MNTIKYFIATAAAMLAAVAVFAQPNIKLRPDETVLLYSNSFEGNLDPVYGKTITYAGYQMAEQNGLSGAEEISKSGKVGNISDLARCDLYFPKKPNGQMVVICPGGGYHNVSSYNEGVYAAAWFLERNITVCVVKYRMPNGHWKVPHADVENAFRYCRAHAEEWGVKQIGVMGFSAGGHLAATASTMWTEDQTRPDFSILIYPVITMEIGITHKGTRVRLIGEKAVWNGQLSDTYSLENQVTRFTPATFIVHCSDDTVVPVENSLRYYNKLIDNGVQAQMHIWPQGDHGWGFNEDQYRDKGVDRLAYARKNYYALLESWLEEIR